MFVLKGVRISPPKKIVFKKCKSNCNTTTGKSYYDLNNFGAINIKS